MTPPSRPRRARDSKLLDMGFLRSIATCWVTRRNHPCRKPRGRQRQAPVGCETLLAGASNVGRFTATRAGGRPHIAGWRLAVTCEVVQVAAEERGMVGLGAQATDVISFGPLL